MQRVSTKRNEQQNWWKVCWIYSNATFFEKNFEQRNNECRNNRCDDDEEQYDAKMSELKGNNDWKEKEELKQRKDDELIYKNFSLFQPILQSSRLQFIRFVNEGKCVRCECEEASIYVNASLQLCINCFHCELCEQPFLSLRQVYEYNDEQQQDTTTTTTLPQQPKLYCRRHFLEQLKPRCCKCDELILDEECTEAESRVYHIDHFNCNECCCSLGGQQYVIKDSKEFCLKCFDCLFGELCEFCGELIHCDFGSIKYQGRNWHASNNCFHCFTCFQSLLGKPFLPFNDGQIYCSQLCANQQQQAREQRQLQQQQQLIEEQQLEQVQQQDQEADEYSNNDSTLEKRSTLTTSTTTNNLLKEKKQVTFDLTTSKHHNEDDRCSTCSSSSSSSSIYSDDFILDQVQQQRRANDNKIRYVTATNSCTLM